MKLSNVFLALSIFSVSCASFAAVDNNGDLVDGIVEITGKIVNQTCTVDSPDSEHVYVTLPTINASLLTGNAQVAGLTPFTINLKNCAAADANASNVGVYFSPAAFFNTDTNTLINTTDTASDGAGNVTVQLLNGDKTEIKIGLAPAEQKVLYSGALPSTGIGSVSLPYYAQYYALGQVSAGLVTASAPFTIVYQ